MRTRWLFVAFSVVLVGAIVTVAAGAAQPAGKGLYKLMGVFGQALALVRSNYVEEVPVAKLEQGAMAGVVAAADPGGAWVPEQDAAAYEAAMSRPLPPFGLVLGTRSAYPFILQVLPGSPAEKAGMLAGELIERIGGEPVRARPLWRAMVLLDAAERGNGETTLEVIDGRLRGKRAVALKNAPFPAPVPRVESRETVRVIRPVSVTATATDMLERELAAHTGAAGLVVDLRAVSLGDAAGAAQMAATLAGGDVALQARQRDGAGERQRAHGEPRTWRVVVALDQTTAGAAEVLALALKQRGATLVGVESYGDTAVRRPHAAAGGTAWMAREWFDGPDGKPILGTGLKPDETVRYRPDGDAILERALELARGAALEKAA